MDAVECHSSLSDRKPLSLQQAQHLERNQFHLNVGCSVAAPKSRDSGSQVAGSTITPELEEVQR